MENATEIISRKHLTLNQHFKDQKTQHNNKNFLQYSTVNTLK